jgi:hypothetical protein
MGKNGEHFLEQQVPNYSFLPNVCSKAIPLIGFCCIYKTDSSLQITAKLRIQDYLEQKI